MAHMSKKQYVLELIDDRSPEFFVSVARFTGERGSPILEIFTKTIGWKDGALKGEMESSVMLELDTEQVDSLRVFLNNYLGRDD